MISFEDDVRNWRAEFGRFETAQAELAKLCEGRPLADTIRVEVGNDAADAALVQLDRRIADARARADTAFAACGQIAIRVLNTPPTTLKQLLDILDIRAAHVLCALGGADQSALVADAFLRTNADVRAVIAGGAR